MPIDRKLRNQQYTSASQATWFTVSTAYASFALLLIATAIVVLVHPAVMLGAWVPPASLPLAATLVAILLGLLAVSALYLAVRGERPVVKIRLQKGNPFEIDLDFIMQPGQRKIIDSTSTGFFVRDDHDLQFDKDAKELRQELRALDHELERLKCEIETDGFFVPGVDPAIPSSQMAAIEDSQGGAMSNVGFLELASANSEASVLINPELQTLFDTVLTEADKLVVEQLHSSAMGTISFAPVDFSSTGLQTTPAKQLHATDWHSPASVLLLTT